MAAALQGATTCARVRYGVRKPCLRPSSLKPCFSGRESGSGSRKHGSYEDASFSFAGKHAGALYVVDADLRKFFDTIPHAVLLERVAEHAADSRDLLRKRNAFFRLSSTAPWPC